MEGNMPSNQISINCFQIYYSLPKCGKHNSTLRATPLYLTLSTIGVSTPHHMCETSAHRFKAVRTNLLEPYYR